jgi:hypothetical protein
MAKIHSLSKRKRTSLKKRTIKRKGGSGKTPKRSPKSPQKFECCMCGKEADKNAVLETTRCSVRGPFYRHKICKDCWWGTKENPGFADEDKKHECPGCRDNKTPVRMPPRKPIEIDLTKDSP